MQHGVYLLKAEFVEKIIKPFLGTSGLRNSKAPGVHEHACAMSTSAFQNLGVLNARK
jgi:hypothetical protein